MPLSSSITIIIPTHNRRELLEETLNSIKAQSYTNWDCIVIDDASTDDTWAFLLAIDDHRFSCLRNDQSRERSCTRNIGLEQANGDLILFLDDDDLLPLNALKLHVENLKTTPDAFCSVGSSQLFWPDGTTMDWVATQRHTIRNITPELLFGWIPVSGQCLFKKERVIAIGGWNEDMSYAEDHEFMLRLASTHPAVVMVEIVHLYRFHGQWRPDNMNTIMTQLRWNHIENMPAETKAKAKSIMAARELREPAEQAYEDSHMFRALKLYLKIFRLAPNLFSSPLTKKDVLPALIKSCLGGPVIRAGRALKNHLK